MILPTPEWKNQLWKDGIGAIDEHLNGFQQWGFHRRTMNMYGRHPNMPGR